MYNLDDFKKRNGMVLIDNYWVEEENAQKYLADRAEAGKKAIAAMETFCHEVKLQWAGSQDGEAVVGFNKDQSIRSVIHLDPHGIQLIHSMSHIQLVEYLK